MAMATVNVRRLVLAGCVAFALASSPVFAQKDDKPGKDDDSKRPKLTLKASPTIAVAPARVVLTAEFNGGSNDYEEYYCPTVEWDWGDGTQSSSTLDCQPYEPGKSEIKRRFTVVHMFRAGSYHVSFRLKRRDKVLTSSSTTIQIQPGLRDIG